jgi:RNA polymerase subunit RPABC4/transcription elongation factor Spt4
MKAKCISCNTFWEYKLDNMKIESDGHDLVVTLYCPCCGHRDYAYNPNDLAFIVEPKHVDIRKTDPVKYEWE